MFKYSKKFYHPVSLAYLLISQQSTKNKSDPRLTTTFIYLNFLQIVVKGQSNFRVQNFGIQLQGIEFLAFSKFIKINN